MNKKQAIVKGLAVVSGWTIARQVGSALSDVGTSAARVGELVKTRLLARRKPRIETFDAAVARLHLTEADLQERERTFAFRAAVAFLVFVIAFAFLAASPIAARWISHALLSAGVMMLAAATAARWHFRACQVRDRCFYGFGGWLIQDVWMRRAAAALAGLVVLALALVAIPAQAQGAGGSGALRMFEPPPGDASVMFLREIFGSVVDQAASRSNSAATPTDSMLGAMLSPFNSAALFLGMVLVAFTTIKGTIDSAHDGQVLGKKMSEIWVPIRIVGGSALLLPLGSGFSLLQVAVLWVAIQSAGIADVILDRAVDYVAETNMVARPHLPDTRQLAAGILRSEVCMAAQNKQYASANLTARIVPVEKTWIVQNTGEIGLGDVALGVPGLVKAVFDASYRVTEFYWREVDNGGPTRLNPDLCGALTWRQSGEASNGNSSTSIAKAPIMAAQANAVRAMIAELRPVAEKIVGFQHRPEPGAIEAAAANYERALAQAANAAVSQTSDARRAQFLESVRAGGWIYLPTYYNQLIQLNDVMQSALNALPMSTPITLDRSETADALHNYRDAMTLTDEYLKARADAPIHERQRQFKQDGEFPTSWGDVKRLLSGFAQTGIYEFTQEIAGSNLSHVGQIKAVGDTIMGSAEALALVAFSASGAANSNLAKVTVGNVFDMGAALGSINPIIMSMVLSLLVFGAVAAYWIPLIPFIVGITAIIKWFTLVFEAVIAAPIWAVAHMHPDGDDAVGRGGAGYMLIIGLMMRPALTVLGFFGSIWLAQPVTGYVNAAYMTAVQGAEHNSFSFITAFISYVIVYVIIMTSVIHAVFALTNWLPDNVLRWIGGALNAHGIGDSETKEAEHKVNAALLAMQRGGHGGGQGGAPKRPSGGGHGEGGGNGKSERSDHTNSDLLGPPS